VAKVANLNLSRFISKWIDWDCPLTLAGKKKPAPPDSVSKPLIPPTAATPPTCAKPSAQFGPNCTCFEDNAAYFGNNHKSGGENRQPNRLACQRSCADHAECKFWTFGKGTADDGPCYLKTKRGDQVTYGMKDYVSGSKDCLLPEAKGSQMIDQDRVAVIAFFDFFAWLFLGWYRHPQTHSLAL
jgi:hypothetical protein